VLLNLCDWSSDRCSAGRLAAAANSTKNVLAASIAILLCSHALADDTPRDRSRDGNRPPNIIFILADDLGYGDLGSFGQTKIRTPNLDAMAAQGMRLTNHYAGNAVCAPSRCVLMTGYHPGHAQIRDNRGIASKKFVDGRPESEGQYPIVPDTVTIASHLKSRGYTCGGFGKWGLGGPGTTGEPLKQGFDRWFGYNCQSVAHNYYPTYLWDNANPIALANSPFPAHDQFRNDEDANDPASYRRFRGDAYSADLIAEQALNFIRDHADKPFFLYWPTTVPHVALQVPEEALIDYQGQFPDLPYKGGRGYIPHYQPHSAYAAMITRMDREIGRAMQIVNQLGLDESTIFVFSSDNGPLQGMLQGLAGSDGDFFNSNGGLRDGKGTLYEGGIRVPTIVKWSGKIGAGTTSDRVSGFEDWLPTFAEIATKSNAPQGMPVPADLDGISLLPTLLGQNQPPRESLYREFPGYGGQQSIRVGHWKAIRRGLHPKPKDRATAQPTKTELYHLADDPAESNDVAEQNRQVVEKLEAMMASQRRPSELFPIALLDGIHHAR
jgi:arylsulfatase A